jgi:hypothetical protein
MNRGFTAVSGLEKFPSAAALSAETVDEAIDKPSNKDHRPCILIESSKP